MACAIQGSNTIEGYNATMDDAIAAVEGEEPMDTDEKTWREIIGYRNAMTYILQLSEDEHFEFHPQLLRSLHFMMLNISWLNFPDGGDRERYAWSMKEIMRSFILELIFKWCPAL